jgi:uncharacterized protein YndB with AHSA1/START domain
VNDTLNTVNGRCVLRMERRVAHPQKKVWRAITEPEHLAHWFPSAVQYDGLHPDAKLTFSDPGGDGPATNGVITELDPPRVFAFTWGDDHLHWELRPDGEDCMLVLTHTFDDRAGAASFAAGWHTCVQALAAFLDGRTIELPHTMDEIAELHEARIAAFGLDEGSVEDTPDGWQVRFERQLTRPIDTVWAMLTGSSEPAAGSPPPAGFTTDAGTAAPVTAVEPPTLLEYGWPAADGRTAGRVRWELGEGTGNGARLVLTQTGPRELTDERDAALRSWRDHVERLAARVATAP